jgi:opacity protein-like surface antigen
MEASSAKQRVGLFALLIGVFSMPFIASAEWYADLYGGGAFTQDTKYRQTQEGVTVDGKLKVDDSFTVGGRTGYWFEGLPWLGIGVDVFYFEPNLPAQTASATATGFGQSITSPNEPFGRSSISVIAIGFDVLRARLPLLRSQQYPHGRLQPYVTAGPALFITKAKDSSGAFEPPNQSKTDTSLGLKVGGGVAFHITKVLALFGEYRFTHFKAEQNFQNAGVFTNGPVNVTTQADFDTHHAIAGLSFHF